MARMRQMRNALALKVTAGNPAERDKLGTELISVKIRTSGRILRTR
jgi:hypothetical protein